MTGPTELFAKCPHCGGFVPLSGLELGTGNAPRSGPIAGPPPVVPVVTPAAEPPPAPAAPASRPAKAPPAPVARSAARATWRNALPIRIWKRYFPPVRLAWIFLLVIVWNVDGFVSRAVALPLLALPAVAALADLGLQATRFPKLRIPDAAIANGLFLSVILWPTTISLELTAIAVVTVGLRHLLRIGGHPVLNPAALGVTLAAVLFALPQPWHVGLTLWDTALIAALGLILWSRAWHTWRLWGVYFAVNTAATLAIADYLGGSHVLSIVLQTTVLGAAPVFYGFFMVSEPRTAPSARWAMVAFGAVVGAVAAILPLLFSERPSLVALGVLTPYLALFAGNVFAVVMPSARASQRHAPAPGPVPSGRLPGGRPALNR